MSLTESFDRLFLWIRYVHMRSSRFCLILPIKFEAEGPEGHSSSIVDLFSSLKSPIDFLMDLDWPDDYQRARFFTALSKVCLPSFA